MRGRMIQAPIVPPNPFRHDDYTVMRQSLSIRFRRNTLMLPKSVCRNPISRSVYFTLEASTVPSAHPSNPPRHHAFVPLQRLPGPRSERSTHAISPAEKVASHDPTPLDQFPARPRPSPTVPDRVALARRGPRSTIRAAPCRTTRPAHRRPGRRSYRERRTYRSREASRSSSMYQREPCHRAL